MKQKKLLWWGIATVMVVGVIMGFKRWKSNPARWPVMQDDILLSSKMNLDISDATVVDEIFANATVLGSEIFRREIGSIQFENRLGGAPKEAWDVSPKRMARCWPG